MNKWTGIGNLTKDVELLMTAKGTSLAKFTIAVNRKYQNQNGERLTDFFNCITFGSVADNLEKYCHKGDKICVIGEIQTDNYEVDGQKRYSMKVVVEDVEFLNTKKTEATAQMTKVEDEPLPF